MIQEHIRVTKPWQSKRKS